MIQVETTCHNRAEAEALAKRILRARLAACVQLGEIASFYHWEGALEEASEVKLSPDHQPQPRLSRLVGKGNRAS